MAVSGPTFNALHLPSDKHGGEQNTLVDGLAEWIQTLGGSVIATANDVAGRTRIQKLRRRREEVPVPISRPLVSKYVVGTPLERAR